MCRWHHSYGRKQRGTEEPLQLKVKEESEKAGLKLNIQKTKIMAYSPITSWQTVETVSDFIFSGSKINADGASSHEIKRHLLLGRRAMIKPRQHFKKQRCHFCQQRSYNPSHGFSSSHVWMWGHKEVWVLKNWCFRTVVLEKTLASPLDCREIKLVNPRRNQLWIFIGRTDAEAKTPRLWPPDEKSWLTKKDAGKDWRCEEKGTTVNEIVGWYHRFSGHEFE